MRFSLLGRRREAAAPLEQAAGSVRHDLVEAPRIPVPPAPVAPRTDLTLLLGRNIDDPFTREICREFGLRPAGSALSYQAPALGVSMVADELGTIATIYLHFNGDVGFAGYPGVIPGRGGTIAKRSSLWVALGRPDQSTDPRRDHGADQAGASDQWRFPTFTMHALYAVDNENLMRLTLRGFGG
jgi:hypothetical protein